MYRVVVIDDEPIIVRGLTQMVPWKKYGCEVVASAGDGKEGLEVIRRVRPDILITDIYMPKMGGLDMAAALRSEFPDMEVSILTGYRDFELAREAINIGVTRFLLKPSNMKELEEALDAMTKKLEKRNQTSAEETADTSLPEQEAGSFLVKKALAYMKSNYSQKLTLVDVAEHTFVSQWHLSKLLNRHTGKNFSELLNGIRVEEAKKLLKDPAYRVGDVAGKVGFQDIAHFSRVFKKITGVSANEYRNRLDREEVD